MAAAVAAVGAGGDGKKRGASRSWILFDATGEERVLDADKYAIMHRVDINARDLRILDPLLSYPSTILGRERAIVLNLEHIKAIITSEEVLLRDPSDDNVIPVVEELRRRLAPPNAAQHDGKENISGQHDVEGTEEDESPFEFRALEVTLEAICSFLDARTTELETDAYPALDELTSKISSRNLDRVRKLKSGMTRLTARVQKVRDELEQLLDDDDDMADLYLSRKLAGASSPVSGSGGPNWFPASPTLVSKLSRVSRASAATIHGNENDVEELEMLLEAYFMQIDGTLNKLTTLREYIDDTEDYINIQSELPSQQSSRLDKKRLHTPLATDDVETGAKLRECREGETLGEDVGELGGGRDMEDPNMANSDPITNEVKIDLHMLCSLMLNRVGELDGADVVAVDKRVSGQRAVKLRQELP